MGGQVYHCDVVPQIVGVILRVRDDLSGGDTLSPSVEPGSAQDCCEPPGLQAVPPAVGSRDQAGGR